MIQKQCKQYGFSKAEIEKPQQGAEKVKIVSLFDEKTKKQQKYMMSLQILGQGKYGKVYKAVNIEKRDTVYAVKVIKLGSSKIKQECIKQLQIIKRLPKCLNLVRIHPQHLQSENNFYIFEEFCSGGTLYDEKMSKKNRNLTYAEQEVFNMFFQIVSGFIELRKAGIFHEDIKPQNILKKNNLYKFTDFGISQLAEKAQISIIRKGTLIYMPPQKLKNMQYVPTSKSQIFSLGVTFYEVIFGQHPYLLKRPLDYRQYLKATASAQLKSVDQLKKIFPNASLAMDKLIRIILRMLQLSQSKRLSLEQLNDYIQNSQPFRSMTVFQSENEDQKNNKFLKNEKYVAIQHSMIICQGDQTQSIESSLTNSQNKNKSLTNNLNTIRIFLNFFRETFAYLQQGISYSKDSKIYEFKKQDNISGFKLPSLSQYLEFLIVYFNDFALKQLMKVYNQIVFGQMTNQQDAMKQIMQVEGDLQYTKNQFLKVFTSIQVAKKKHLLQYTKNAEEKIGNQLSKIFTQTFKIIDCIRINFKDDILAILFCKHCPVVIQYFIGALQLLLRKQKGIILQKYLNKPQYQQASKIIKQFNVYQSTRREKLQAIVQQEMKGQHQVLFDIQSNSDEFQELNFEEECIENCI